MGINHDYDDPLSVPYLLRVWYGTGVLKQNSMGECQGVHKFYVEFWRRKIFLLLYAKVWIRILFS